jgi:membrane protein implicated in regulation of membrane protease activity
VRIIAFCGWIRYAYGHGKRINHTCLKGRITVLTVVASLLNVVLLVFIALVFAMQGWPEHWDPWMAFSIGVMVAVPIVNLVALWYPRRRRPQDRGAIKDVREELNEIRTLLKRIEGKS